MNKLKIAWVTGSNFFNVDEPLMRLLSRDFDIIWVVFTQHNEKEKAEIYKKFEAAGVKGWVQELYRYRSLKTLMVYIKTLSKLKKEAAAIYYIDFLGMPYFFPVLRVMRIRRQRLVYACHDFIDHVNIKNRGFISKYKRFIFHTVGSVKLFSESQYVLFKAEYKRIHAFYSPLCLQDYGMPTIDKKKDGIVRFLFFGLIRGNKGVEILIQAANRLYNEFPGQFIVLIYGKADNWEQYDKLIECRSCFELMIRRINNAEIPNLFSTSDYLVLPYRDVTQSGPLSIAYCYNIPVIASDHDGFKEFIKDGETGLLFKNGDNGDLYRVMKNVVMGKIDYDLMRLRQKQFTDEHLSLSRIVDMYSNMFNELSN